MKKLVACAFALSTLALSGAALAQEGSDYATSTDKDGYTVKFDDDLLDAPGLDSNAPLLKVRPMAARTTLIRPRTSFVPELLKSVDTL